jgi:hypothetical protein
MSQYSSEPVPSSLEPVTAEYLNRQFNAIGLALAPEGQIVVPKSGVVPERPVEGGIVYVIDDGLYACIKTEANGVAEWMKIAPIEGQVAGRMGTPEASLSGKTWNDFL